MPTTDGGFQSGQAVAARQGINYETLICSSSPIPNDVANQRFAARPVWIIREILYFVVTGVTVAKIHYRAQVVTNTKAAVPVGGIDGVELR